MALVPDAPIAHDRLAAAYLSAEIGAALYGRRPSFPVDRHGAVRLNRAGFRLIEEQSVGTDWLRRGLFASDEAMRRTGWRILDWGLARQQADGGFGGGDRFHSAMRYLASLALALHLDPRAASRRLPGFAVAIGWLERPDVLARGLKNDQPYTHRAWMRAALLMSAGSLLNDQSLAERARPAIEFALAKQWREGAFPEKRGHDVAYQLYATSFCQRALMLCDDAALAERIAHAEKRALAWSLGRMDAETGKVSIEGAARTACERGLGGNGKSLSYTRAAEVFIVAWLRTGKRRYRDAATASLRADAARREARRAGRVEPGRSIA